MANDEQDDPFAKMIEDTRKQLEQLARDNPGNILYQLMQALFGSFSAVFDEDYESDAPDFEDGDDSPEDAKTARENYKASGGYESEHGQYDKYRGDIRGHWKTSDAIVVDMRKLAQLRIEAEARNAGRHVDAKSPVHGVVGQDFRFASHFGARHAPTAGASTNHPGLDIAPLPKGSNVDVFTAMPGIVINAGPCGGYGNMVEIMDIYGIIHRYGHLKSMNVHQGQVINEDTQIGVMGSTGRSTGVHLHYEQREVDPNNPRRTRPFDPEGHTSFSGHSVASVHSDDHGHSAKPAEPEKTAEAPKPPKQQDGHPLPPKAAAAAKEAAKPAATPPKKQEAAQATLSDGLQWHDVTQVASVAFSRVTGIFTGRA